MIVVGRIVRPHGLAGQVVVLPESDDPDRFRPGSRFLTREGLDLTVRSSQTFERGLLVKFEGISDRTAAEGMRGAELLIPITDRRELGADEYWPDELVGLEVRDAEGVRLGEVVGVEDTTAQHRLLVDSSQRLVLIPLVKALVPEVNLSGGFVVISPIPGLLDENEA